VWDTVVSRLDRRDVLTVSLPGFGCPVPDGFSATKEAYVDWLLGELHRLLGPIDVVGHDWGALLTVRVVSLLPRLRRLMPHVLAIERRSTSCARAWASAPGGFLEGSWRGGV